MVAEDDDVDAVVDGWTQRLTVEHQPVFFEDLLREDIEMRTQVVEEEKAEEEPTLGDTSDAPGGVVLGQKQFQEAMLAGLNALNQKVAESRELMLAGFKEIKEEMKSLDERVTGVEKFVSEYRMEGDLPSVINLSQGHGRYDPAPHDPLRDSFNLLATAASKVTEKRVEEEEDVHVGKGVEVEKNVSGEQIVEKDKTEEKKKKEKKKGKKQGKAQEQEVQEEADQEQAKPVEEGREEKKQKKRKTHSALTKAPFGRPNTRQKTTTEGNMD